MCVQMSVQMCVRMSVQMCVSLKGDEIGVKERERENKR